MNNITSITRNDSYEEIKGNCQIRYEQIINILKNGPKTAKEVSVALKQLDFIKVDDRNCAAPRLTELEQMKYVKAIKTKKCEYTGKKVAVYQLTEEIIQKLNNNEPILFFRKKEGKNMKNNSLKQEKQLNPIIINLIILSL